MKTSDNERQKWDECYASVSSYVENELAGRFSKEFGDMVLGLLPPGSEVLEAGCGTGRQSRSIARLGKYRVNLMDFSEEALDCAQQLFEREKLQAHFVRGDVFQPGRPTYDLVFNAGVLEHYTFDEQVALLRGMASRSQRYVMVLVPNARCYWYWLWRIQKAGEGKWPYGKEVPVTDVSSVFKRADLEFLGQRFMGEGLTEEFVSHLTGLDERLRHHILEVHRSPVIPKLQKAYLVAALGRVSVQGEDPPPGWTAVSQIEEDGVSEMRAALADALALRISADHKLRDLQSESTKRIQVVQQLETLKRELAAARDSFSFQFGNLLVQAVHRPGRNTILLPYRLVRLSVMRTKRPSNNALRAL